MNLTATSQKNEHKFNLTSSIQHKSAAEEHEQEETLKILVEQLSVYYGTFRALRDVNLKIPDKKISAIIGPSGCGKSTLLRSINRMNDLLQALYNSDNLNRYDPANYQSFIDQSFWLYEKLLKPALSQFSHADELILIPDGKLCYLPFEALVSKLPQNPSEVNYEKLDYLLLDFTVRYEYSAGLLNFHRSKSLTSHSSVYSGFAPFYGSNSALNQVRVLGKRAGFLSSLKYNVEEIEDAAEIFKGKAYLGKDATKPHFRNSISSKIV